MIEMADEIWGSEIRFQEFKASKLLSRLYGGWPEITWDIGGLNAFVAEWRQGEAGPVIGFAGEYDALPGLSQKVQNAGPHQAGGHG
ncbi:MAG: hypothetical protein R2911_24625 [Caldilineaceae bacterium]